ncbi:S-adenosyl-l-methionine hydroxide adenosyltransferase family protein [Micromonospora sp. NPDC050417]|uniref:S-adenosyl-l-methionine hydroxide adenosyltransferase family protein n=1 Tax=Micromonospora sp. NPDC050417 TaxID=3364280 RepID=UPI0037B249AF
MRGYGWISLTTDYGLTDGFVAACHGTIARLAPAVRVLDVTHLVPPGDIGRGATVLAQTVGALPAAVHVAVVDPGVGTNRRGVALRCPDGLLVGPDNGLLPWAAQALGGIEGAVELTNPEWLAPRVCATFHGRDVFAPVAARLALGADPDEAGPAIDPAELVRLPEPVVAAGPGWLTAEILSIDHFGNVQLAAPAAALAALGTRLRVQGLPAHRAATFGDVPVGNLVVFEDSAGQAAVAVNGGRADAMLSLVKGQVLRITDAS